MISQATQNPQMIYPINVELHYKTKEVLTQIAEMKDWSQNSSLENWKIKLFYLSTSLGFGSIMAGIPPLFSLLTSNPICYSYSTLMAMTGSNLISILNSPAEKSRVTKLSNRLNTIIVSYKQENDSHSKAIAKKLEKIIKIGNDYIKSRNYGENCLVATLAITGFAGMVAEYGSLPESLTTPTFLIGLTATTTFAFCHYIYKKEDLQKISQKISKCLEMLEQQKQLMKQQKQLIKQQKQQAAG